MLEGYGAAQARVEGKGIDRLQVIGELRQERGKPDGLGALPVGSLPCIGCGLLEEHSERPGRCVSLAPARGTPLLEAQAGRCLDLAVRHRRQCRKHLGQDPLGAAARVERLARDPARQAPAELPLCLGVGPELHHHALATSLVLRLGLGPAALDRIRIDGAHVPLELADRYTPRKGNPRDLGLGLRISRNQASLGPGKLPGDQGLLQVGQQTQRRVDARQVRKLTGGEAEALAGVVAGPRIADALPAAQGVETPRQGGQDAAQRSSRPGQSRTAALDNPVSGIHGIGTARRGRGS